MYKVKNLHLFIELDRSICHDKLERRQYFIFHIKGTPSHVKHKTILRCLMISCMTLSGQSHFKRMIDFSRCLTSAKQKMRHRDHNLKIRQMIRITQTPLGDETESHQLGKMT
jgi:hypothetical protein